MVRREAVAGAVLMVAVAACAHEPPGTPPAPIAVGLPSTGTPPGWKLPPGAYVTERNRCIDRELSHQKLNPFGDPEGTVYPEGEPLEVRRGTDRYQYVLRHRPDVAVTCTRTPVEQER
jgi:hypothetical protein